MCSKKRNAGIKFSKAGTIKIHLGGDLCFERIARYAGGALAHRLASPLSEAQKSRII